MPSARTSSKPPTTQARARFGGDPAMSATKVGLLLPAPQPSVWVVLAAGNGWWPRLLGKGCQRQRTAGGVLEYLAGLLSRARVQLDQHVDDDLVAVVLVEAHVGEELARSVVAERTEGERVGRVRARARFHLVLVDGHGAGGHPRGPDDHPLPAVVDGLDARDTAAVLLVEGEVQVRLVVQAVQALDDCLLHLLNGLDRLAGLGVDLEDALVMDLNLEVLRPAAVAAQPTRRSPHLVRSRTLHNPIMVDASTRRPRLVPAGGPAITGPWRRQTRPTPRYPRTPGAGARRAGVPCCWPSAWPVRGSRRRSSAAGTSGATTRNRRRSGAHRSRWSRRSWSSSAPWARGTSRPSARMCSARRRAKPRAATAARPCCGTRRAGCRTPTSRSVRSTSAGKRRRPQSPPAARAAG